MWDQIPPECSLVLCFPTVWTNKKTPYESIIHCPLTATTGISYSSLSEAISSPLHFDKELRRPENIVSYLRHRSRKNKDHSEERIHALIRLQCHKLSACGVQWIPWFNLWSGFVMSLFCFPQFALSPCTLPLNSTGTAQRKWLNFSGRRRDTSVFTVSKKRRCTIFPYSKPSYVMNLSWVLLVIHLWSMNIQHHVVAPSPLSTSEFILYITKDIVKMTLFPLQSNPSYTNTKKSNYSYKTEARFCVGVSNLYWTPAGRAPCWPATAHTPHQRRDLRL